jgi:diguanylate cyclase (GGDEF)-like protein
MSARQSLIAAERIRAQVEANPVSIGEGAAPVAMTVSVGTATCAGESLAMEVLLARADEAVYRAKHEGRNRVCSWSPK